MLATHYAVTTNSGKAQQKLGKIVNQGRHAAHKSVIKPAAGDGTPAGNGRPAGRERNHGLGQGSTQ